MSGTAHPLASQGELIKLIACGSPLLACLSLGREKEMPGRLVEDGCHHPSTQLIGLFDIKDWWMGDRFMNC